MIWTKILTVYFCSQILFYSTCATTGGLEDSCDTPLTQGLSDSQFSSSTEYNQTHDARAARTGNDGWIASDSDQYQHLKLDFEDIWEITKISVQGTTKGWYTRSFRVTYSNDNDVWTPYNTRLSTDPLGELFNRQGATTVVDLNPSLKARYIAINPVSYYQRPALRLELYGCEHSSRPTTNGKTVQNTIGIDTSWIPSQSPIIVDQPVVIRPAVTLKIQAGVSVIFTTKDAGIDVWGTLMTTGINGLEVLLSSKNPVLAANSQWKGVVQKTGGYVTMENTVLRQAVWGLQGNGSHFRLADSNIHSCLHGIRMSGGSVHNVSTVDMATDVEHVALLRMRVHDNVDGLLVHGILSQPNIYIAHSAFDQNKENGLVISNWDVSDQDTTTNLIIFNTSFSRNSIGIKSDKLTLTSFYIHHSSFIRNTKTGMHYYHYWLSKDLVTVFVDISNSQFLENNYYGIRAELYCLDCEFSLPLHNLSFTHNLFSRETRAITIYYTVRKGKAEASIEIYNNTFISNSYDVDLFYALKGPVQISIDNNSFSRSRFPLKIICENIEDKSVSIQKNVFTDCLSISSNDEAIKIKGITAQIIYNTFQNCSMSTMIVLLDGIGHSFAFNALVNTNASNYYLKIEQEYENNSFVILDNNYWGTVDMQFVKSKVYDFFLDSTKAVAKLNLYFPNEKMETASSSALVDSFRSTKDEEKNVTFIGGIIRTSLDFSTIEGNELILDRSLLIVENAHVDIDGVNITIMQNRGIKVYGSLKIGDRYDITRSTVLQLQGTIGRINKWNGICLYSADLDIYNLEIEGTDTFVEVDGNGSAIVLYNCSSTNNRIQHLINANVFGGNFSLLIENSNVTTRSTLVNIRYATTNIGITVLNSDLQSEENIIDARETGHQENTTQVYLFISTSSFNSSFQYGRWLMHLEGCATYLTSFIMSSTFSAAKSHRGIILMKYSSIDLTAVGNTFGDAKDVFNFEFCGNVPSSNSKDVNITANVFDSSSDGYYIRINEANAQDQNHNFYIANNTFEGRGISSRTGIYCNSFSRISRHILDIDSNVFKNINESAIYANCGSKLLSVRNNWFMNNKKCVSVHGTKTFYPIDGFEIFGNTFLNNSNQKGIIYLDRTEYGNEIVNISGNIFKENTGTIIALNCPDIRIKHNYFENEDALYNVKVISDHFSEQSSVNASLNYWGTTDVNEIKKGIYDFQYDETLLLVDFRPYLGSKNISDIQNDTGLCDPENGKVCGDVNGNVTLPHKGSPYLVISNINVNENDTLTLEAGVELRVKAGVGIFVQGKLHILGRKEMPVKFISEKTGQPWRGIDFNSHFESVLSYMYLNDTLEGITLRGSAVSIHNITSSYSQQCGITIEPKNMQNAADYNFSDVLVENNLEDGLKVSGDQITRTVEVTVRNCVSARNRENGIRVSTNAKIQVFNCSIAENEEGGVYLQQNRGGILYMNNSILVSNVKYAIEGRLSRGIFLNSCQIRNHTFGYYYYRWHTREHIKVWRASWIDIGTSVVFKNTLFHGNTADWIEISKHYGDFNLNIVFENNVFTGGRRTLLYKDSNYPSKAITSVSFINNTIEENSIHEDYKESGLIEFSIGSASVNNISVIGNKFYKNSARTCLSVSTQMENINEENINILENVFQDNNVSLSVIDIQGRITPQIHRNIFISKYPQNCSITAPVFYIPTVVNATHNYWGTNVAREVVEKVCGFEKDMKNSIVLTFPFFENENLTSLVPATQRLGSGVFGGELKTDTYITQAEWASPVNIYRSIIIREGAGLYVQSGVVLQFAKNRGIYVQGTLVMIGGDSNVVLESDTRASYWFGIVINSTLYNSTEKVQMQNTRLRNTLHGILAYTPNFEIKRSEIIQSTTNCLTLFLTKGMASYDFQFTKFESCGWQGINVTGAGNISIINAHIINTLHGISVRSAHTVDDVTIHISKNTFENVAENALSVVVPANDLAKINSSRVIRVEQNTYTNSCGVLIQTWNNEETTLRGNDFSSSDCSKDDKCFILVFANDTETVTQYGNFDISANLFKNISDKCIIELKDNGLKNLHRRFVYNTLQDNKAIDGVVLANARYFNISKNIFENPSSVFDVITELKGSISINVTNNWWGSSDQDHVFTRISDQRRAPELILFQVEPVLLDLSIDCSDVSNCSSHGKCISPNHCRCSSGWEGPSCSQFHCSGVNNCYGNGVCVDSNQCSCYEGWSGKQCVIASCSNVNNCSGHGLCVQPNVCACAARFTDNDCNSCISLHGGSTCQPCPECQHGKCSSKTGLCECDDVNWTGYLCDKCSEAFYGQQCLPLIKVLEILPNSGPEIGGSEVHVWGHNFMETLDNTYQCQFGNKESEGKRIAWNHVVCTAPRHPEGEVTLEISPENSEYTNDRLTYNFYSTCLPGSCGRSFNPSRGQCVFGTCSCFLPWTGENCAIEIISPIIAAVDVTQTAGESETYTIPLKLKQGDLPIRWYLAKGPAEMNVDEKTGFVRWANTFADSSQYLIDVRASNVAGEDSVKWLLFVPASYTAVVQDIEPRGVLPMPRPIKVFGKVVFPGEERTSPVQVQVIITSARSGRQKLLKTVTDQGSPDKFRTIYYPRPDDAGLFSVTATHPGIPLEPNATNVTWSVLGMQCEPSTVTVDSEINLNTDTVIVTNISTLINTGDIPISYISSEVYGLPDAFVRHTSDVMNLNLFMEQLDIDDHIIFDLHIGNARPLYGTIYITFTTKQGTSTGLKVHITLSAQKPMLSLNPPSLRENILRGTIAIIDVNITNVGEILANDVTVSLPNDPRLSLISFTDESNELNESPGGYSIQPQGVAHLSISVVTESTEPLGEMSGTIYINSKLSSNPLPYLFIITSVRKFNVTFTVKDEYTYFASGSPHVSNATVRLSNPRRGLSETRYTTNETGYVVFENMYEDRYSLYAEADDHSSYGAVILVTPDTTEQDIFLQRVAVKYTWTVEPTAVEDVYKIELNSTFETYVPMPVVTIEPAHIDTLPLEIEGNSTIEFTVTNHGLIRADNIRFSLPKTHPFLIFESQVDFIGNIAANTSIIVPVKTTLRSREKRSSGSTCGVDIILLYDFKCFGVQTRSSFVKLTRGQSGRTCIFSIFGGGGRIGGGFSIAYSQTTPISCDCAKTLIKSCVLSYVPGFGCLLAVGNAIPLFAKGSSDGISFEDGVLRTLDFLFGCFSIKDFPIIGDVYTAVRCVLDMEAACAKGRKRREVSSEVVNAVVLASRPMENFIYMGKEILGNVSVSLETTWYNEFKMSVGDNSELGAILSRNESANILQTVTEEMSTVNLSRFLERYNNTAAAWDNGSLSQLEDTGRVISFSRLKPMFEQFLNDMDTSVARGYGSIFDEYEKAVEAYNKAEQHESMSSGSRERDGVCARVRIKIVQELVLTRDAFNAKLEIENGEKSDLENIKVEIQIKQTFGSGDLLNDKFSFGKPTLTVISSVDGSGRLGIDLSGSAEWLIIPYSNAAPEDDTQYDIGGRLSYTVDGSDFSTTLLPDTIIVKPNPSLVVEYFHEKYVRGDDALTPEVEPIIPFTLAVMVINHGYGVARALKITSGQPEITENEKGLLITFKITSAQLGNTPITPSLTVNFGDISSFETKTARWLMTSTLMGTFYNYSASFENINPLGDPQLSLIDKVGYHELFHLVRIQIPEDDELDDFLVNDMPDQDGIPEKLYNGANGTDVYDVHFTNVTDVHVRSFVRSSSKVYKQVNLTVSINMTMWFYTRTENTFTNSDVSANEELLCAVTHDGRKILLGKNLWQTTHIFDTFFVHLFDFVDMESWQENADNAAMVYTLTYGPRNWYAPRFNSSSYNFTVSNTAVLRFEIVRIHAYDIDKDNLEFKLKNENVTQFSIKQVASTSAAVLVHEKLSSPGLVTLEVVVEDDGVPPRSSDIGIYILITDESFGGNTTDPNFATTTALAGNNMSSSVDYTYTSIHSNPSTKSIYTDTVTGNNSNTTRLDGGDSSDSIPLWIIFVCIVGFIMLILLTVIVVCVVRRKVYLPGGNDNIELK